MKIYICGACSKVCELIEEDHGGMSEAWGAPFWHAMPTDVTDCCGETCYEEVDEEEYYKDHDEDEEEEPEHDGQPDEAQEWHDFDPDC